MIFPCRLFFRGKANQLCVISFRDKLKNSPSPALLRLIMTAAGIQPPDAPAYLLSRHLPYGEMTEL